MIDKKLQFNQQPSFVVYKEGSETIPQGSTLLNNGSAMPQTDNAVGDDIVQNKNSNAFIQKARTKYNNKFDYNKVNYVSAKTKVVIICPKHGEFLQTPDKHLQSKYGCPKCANEHKKPYSITNKRKRINNRLLSKEQFIEIANKKYNNKYKYIIEDWNGDTKSNIKVICPTHGIFETNARNHIQPNNKYGCPKCGHLHAAEAKTKLYADVVAEMSKKYNNYYTYVPNKENYINQRTKIEIICPKHGKFVKSVQKHLSGQGCPQCKMEHNIENHIWPGGYTERLFELNSHLKNKDAYLYYLNINNGRYYKIGITVLPILRRINSLKSLGKKFGYDLNIVPVATLKTSLYDAYMLEQQILLKYNKHRTYQKWSTELFNIDIFNKIQSNFDTIF